VKVFVSCLKYLFCFSETFDCLCESGFAIAVGDCNPIHCGGVYVFTFRSSISLG
jgi:hypothetical protein